MYLKGEKDVFLDTLYIILKKFFLPSSVVFPYLKLYIVNIQSSAFTLIISILQIVKR